jgi:DNA-directed RNA polymerase subunit M/transcription elongation factor TFIIS
MLTGTDEEKALCLMCGTCQFVYCASRKGQFDNHVSACKPPPEAVIDSEAEDEEDHTDEITCSQAEEKETTVELEEERSADIEEGGGGHDIFRYTRPAPSSRAVQNMIYMNATARAQMALINLHLLASANLLS